MNTQIVITDTARSDLCDIALNLAELAKYKNLAIRFVKELQEKTIILEEAPLISANIKHPS